MVNQLYFNKFRFKKEDKEEGEGAEKRKKRRGKGRKGENEEGGEVFLVQSKIHVH